MTGSVPTAAMPSRPLRIAIFGAGKMAQAHATAIGRTTSGAEVVAIADPSAEARQAMSALVPTARLFASPEELLVAEAVDVVHIVTPPATHRALAVKAIAAGCHVYVEKPFAESTAAAQEVLEQARARGLKICAGHQLLFEPPSRGASQLLPALGHLVHVESYFSFRPVRRTPGGRVPMPADLQLLDILPHPIYLLLDFLERSAQGKTEIDSVHLGEGGTVHALVRRGGLTGTLVVTLEGRPVESYVRLVGRNGSVHADYVRSTVQRLIGPGTSGIDKLLAPYRIALQLFTGTTAAMSRRVFKRQRSYPGLAELFDAFYAAIASGGPSPTSPESILETTRIWQRVSEQLDLYRSRVTSAVADRSAPVVAVTGGTGFLGRQVARTLAAQGASVRVLARRLPAPWERLAGVDYEVVDLGGEVPVSALRGARIVIHAAAETAGGWTEHQRNSLDATEHVLRAAAAAGVKQFIHVSSLAVLADRGGAMSDTTPLEPNTKGSGPYVWGKLESERLARQLGQELGVAVKVARPGAIVDYDEFDPPGRLGKRLGGLFVAVGSPGQRLGVVDLGFAARVLAWMTDHFDEAPEVFNLLAPSLPAKRELIVRLRQTNPDIRVIWLPTLVLHPLSWLAFGLQKLLRPRRPAINVAKVFSVQAYDTSTSARLAAQLPALPGTAVAG